MSAVLKMPVNAGDKPAEAPALGFSLQVDLGAGRAGVFQTHVPQDCSAKELNTLLNKLNRVGDAQRAHYQIEEEEREIEIVTKMQENHLADLEVVDRNFEKEHGERLARLKKAQVSFSNYLQAAQQAHEASGRRGPYEPKSTEKTKVSATERDIEALKQEIADKIAEKNVTHEKGAELQKQWTKQLEKHRAKIEKCQAVIDRGMKE